MVSKYYNWNRLILSAEWRLFKIFEKFGSQIYDCNCFNKHARDFIEVDLYKTAELISAINENFYTNIPEDINPTVWEINTEMVRQDFLSFFKTVSIEKIRLLNLFKILLDKPEEELRKLILKTIETGYFAYLEGDFRSDNEVYTVIQSKQTADELCTTMIIKCECFQEEINLIDIFPARAIIQSEETPKLGTIKFCAENLGTITLKEENADFSFWNFLSPLQKKDFAEGKENPYLFWGLAYSLDAEIDTKEFNFMQKKFNSFVSMIINFEDYEEFYYEDVKIIKVLEKYNGVEFPVYISEKMLPCEIENLHSEELKLKVLICGQFQPEMDVKV